MSKTLTLKVKKAKSITDKIFGLIGKKSCESLFLQTRFGIHTYGLRFPIDVLVLDNKNKVICLKEEIQPGRFYFWNPKYKSVLELPAGTISRLRIKNDDMIDLKYPL